MATYRVLNFLLKSNCRTAHRPTTSTTMTSCRFEQHRKFTAPPTETADERDCRLKKQLQGLVVGLYEKEGDKEAKLTTSGEKFDDQLHGKLVELLRECNITGTLGKGKVFNGIDTAYGAVAVVGLGKAGAAFDDLEVIDEGLENVRVAAGVGARALQLQGCTQIFVDNMDFAEQAAEGSALAVWRLNTHIRQSQRVPIPKLQLYEAQDADAWTRGLFKAESQNLARRLSDTPSNQMTPTIFAQATVDALCPCGVAVEVRTMDWIEKMHLNSFLTIAKGSCEPPILLEITYCGTAPEDKPILLVGKGITYNSGGLSLREKCSLDEYRGSMCGAAVCVATIRAAAALSLPINVCCVLPLCENMPSGMACKPGDVVTLLNGKTIGVRDLDKAGTVLMLDTLLYAQTNFKPKTVVHMGCMAQGVRKGLGGCATGIFSNSNFLYKEFERAGAISGDRVWRLPFWKYFERLVKCNKTFDLSNNGIGPASSCLAAAILGQAMPCVDWVHLDMRGTGLLTKHGVLPYLLKGQMTGRPTRTLIQFLYQMACPK